MSTVGHRRPFATRPYNSPRVVPRRFLWRCFAMAGPLAGVKVLDFTRYQNGPHATLMLSDFGADVLKVEGPGFEGRGDISRQHRFNSYFESLNRGKRAISVNLRAGPGLWGLGGVGGVGGVGGCIPELPNNEGGWNALAGRRRSS